jgi:hypothetical protein
LPDIERPDDIRRPLPLIPLAFHCFELRKRTVRLIENVQQNKNRDAAQQ